MWVRGRAACLDVGGHARAPQLHKRLDVPLAHALHRRHRVQPLWQLLQFDHSPRQSHGQLATEEGGDLDERALPPREPRRVLVRRQQQPQPRVERGLQRDRRLLVARQSAHLVVEGLVRVRRGGGEAAAGQIAQRTRQRAARRRPAAAGQPRRANERTAHEHGLTSRPPWSLGGPRSRRDRCAPARLPSCMRAELPSHPGFRSLDHYSRPCAV